MGRTAAENEVWRRGFAAGVGTTICVDRLILGLEGSFTGGAIIVVASDGRGSSGITGSIVGALESPEMIRSHCEKASASGDGPPAKCVDTTKTVNRDLEWCGPSGSLKHSGLNLSSEFRDTTVPYFAASSARIEANRSEVPVNDPTKMSKWVMHPVA